GGHTHTGTLGRPFIRQGKKRYAVLTGAYTIDNDFGRQLGMAETHGRGCGATIHYPDGSLLFMDDLETAADFLQYLNWRRDQEREVD
ncbi:hypothetical protein ACFLWA_12845, partial [Chloroflexota bacterium]